MVKGLKLGNLKWWKRIICLFILLGGIQFIVLTSIAMFFYPDGYSFTEHYLSHLGIVRTFENRKLNTIPRILFVTACFLAGFALIFFWFIITKLFREEDNLTKFFSYFSSLIGILSGPSLIALGVFASDTHHMEHIISTVIFFFSCSGAIFIYSIAIIRNKNYQNYYAFVGFAFSILIVLFIFRYFYFINPLMQKIIVYGFIAWTALQLTKIWKYINE